MKKADQTATHHTASGEGETYRSRSLNSAQQHALGMRRKSGSAFRAGEAATQVGKFV